jgi:hypothetical protein
MNRSDQESHDSSRHNGTIFVYDLPRTGCTSKSLAIIIKERTGYEIKNIPSVRRDLNSSFYTAMIKIEDSEKFDLVAQALRYFTIDGKACRALPYSSELAT